MPISTTCPNCQRPLRVPDELIGQAVRCPACATTWNVEQPAAESPPEPPPAPPPPPENHLDDGIRDTPERLESRPAADEHVRETPGGPAAPVPPPPPSSDDGYDDDDDLEDEEFERGLEGRYGRRRSARLVAEAKSKLLGPCIGVFIISGLVLLAALFRIMMGLFSVGMIASSRGPASALIPQAIMPVYGIWLALLGGLGIFGGFQMLKLRSHSWSIVACVITMIPCNDCCFLLGLPFGIWGIVTLCQPDVKRAFQVRASVESSRPKADDGDLLDQ